MITVYGLKLGTYQAYKNADRVFVNFAYLHGDLEEENGFDLIGVSEMDYAYLNSNDHLMEECVTVLSKHGKKIPSILYWWHNGEQARGLVVAKADEVHAEDAFNKYITRKQIL